MNWLEVIRAGRAREVLLNQLEEDDQNPLPKGDIFEDDVGKETNLDPLEAAALAAVFRITASQLQILSMGAAPPSTALGRAERDKLLEVVQDTELELRRRRSFTVLFESAREEARKMKEMAMLEAIAVRNKNRMATLRSRLEGNEKAKQKELHKKQEVIASLKDQIQDLVSRRDVTLSYIDRSEAARREDNVLRCANAEEVVRAQVDALHEQTSSELRVHDDLAAFLNLSMKKLKEEMASWNEFYVTEMERRKEKLQVLRDKIAEEAAKVGELTDLYEEHRREMNEYLEYKEQKRLEAEHDQFLYDTATKIQAWWRGTMVRRGLGPYKRRKKPPKDKKKKK